MGLLQVNKCEGLVSVFNVRNGESSVEAWFSSAAPDFEEVLSGACDSRLRVTVSAVCGRLGLSNSRTRNYRRR